MKNYYYKFLSFTMTNSPLEEKEAYDKQVKTLVNDLGTGWEIYKEYLFQPAVTISQGNSITIPAALAFILKKEI